MTRLPTITPGTLEARAVINESSTKGDYLMKIYRTSKAEIMADGSFMMVVAAGKNSFSISDFQQYQTVAPGTRQELIDQYLDFEIKAEHQSEIVFRVRGAIP